MFSVDSVRGGLKKRLILYFECFAKECDCCFKGDSGEYFKVTTTIVSKWMKVLYHASKVGVAVYNFDPLEAGYDLYETGKEIFDVAAEKYDSTYQALKNEDFLTSAEQDEIINLLQEEQGQVCFYDEFKFSAEKGKWMCNKCHERAKNMIACDPDRAQQNFSLSMEGYLEKQSRRFLSFGNWQSRHVRIFFDNDNKAIEYTNPQKNESESSKNPRCISLEDVSGVYEEIIYERHCFVVITKESVYVFSAKEKDETVKWTRALQSCMKSMDL